MIAVHATIRAPGASNSVMNQSASDDELVGRARRGDRDAVARLYERHASRVYAVARRLADDDEQAADWAQEAWIRVFRALPSFRGEARFTTWLHRITVNAALHGHRSNQRRRARMDELESIADQPRHNDTPLMRMTLEQAVDRLPPGMRQVLVLHDVEGYTHEEIGEMLGVKPGTCKSQLFKARARLREILEPSRIETESICTT